MKMKKLLLALFLLTLSNIVIADYSGEHVIEKIRVKADGMLQIGTTPQASNTCKYFGYQFALDTTTATGKSMLSMLLLAKTSDKKINIWYAASTAPGTDETDGCTEGSLATFNAVGLD